MTTADAIIEKWKKYSVQMIMRKIGDQPKASWEELPNNLKAVGLTVTRNTVDSTLGHDGLKSCSSHKIPLLEKAYVEFVRLRKQLNPLR